MIRRSFLSRLLAACGVAVAVKVVPAEEPAGLASLIGKYENDPTWEEFPAWRERYGRSIDVEPVPPQNGDIWLDLADGTYHLYVNGKWMVAG